MIDEKRIAEIEALPGYAEPIDRAVARAERNALHAAIRDLLAERRALVGVLYGFKVVVNSYIPPGTIVMHADEAECMRVWRENQKRRANHD